MVEALTAAPDALSRNRFSVATPERPYRAALRLSIADLSWDGARGDRMIAWAASSPPRSRALRSRNDVTHRGSRDALPVPVHALPGREAPAQEQTTPG
jgi:hypothetical protein